MERSTDARNARRRWLLGLGLAAGLAVAVVLSGPAGAWGRHGHGFEHRIEHMLDALDASDEQRVEIRSALESLHDALAEGRDSRRDGHRAIAAALTGETVDLEAIEAIRAEHVERFDALSRQAAQALVKVAGVLSPEQRREIAGRLEEHEGHHGGRGWH